MKDKVWEVDFDGHKIRAINKISIFPPRTSEVLEVDDTVIKHVKGSFFRMHSTIKTTYDFSGVERKVEARMAQKTGSVRTGCQVLIDGDLVGGDDVIQYPDPEKDKKQFEKGYLRYFLTVGLLNYGLPYAIMMLFLGGDKPAITIFWMFAFHALFVGGVVSYVTWRGIKSRVSATSSPDKTSNPTS